MGGMIEGPYQDGNLKLHAGARITADSSISGPVFLKRNAQIGPRAVVGRYLCMNENASIRDAKIGAFCTIGARTAINAPNHPADWLSVHEFQFDAAAFDHVREYCGIKRQPLGHKTVTIGNDVWMGHNVTVLPGVTVGDGSIIGANSVVTCHVLPYTIVAGAPAQFIRRRFKPSIIDRLLRAKWWERELTELSTLPFQDIERCLGMLEQRHKCAA